MRFLFPLGLLGLIGIPVIILIYILQSKYREQTVNSNYIWHLSDKFMKRRNPLSGITGLISLILQILLVAFVSFAISRPIFTLPDAANEYCFVLDASGSMNTYEGEKTRFDRAKDEISGIINSSSDGSTFSLIVVSDEAVKVYEGIKDKENANELLYQTNPSHTLGSEAELLSCAQSVFDQNPSTLVYLATDKSYKTHNNIDIIDVGTDTLENYTITNVDYSHTGGRLTVTASVISHISDTTLDVSIYLENQKMITKKIDVKGTEEKQIELECICPSLKSFEIRIENEDSYMLDNSVMDYNPKSDKTYSVLIVSKSGFFLEAVIDSLVDSDIRVVSPSVYETIDEKYGLYIFDSYTPSSLPDGAVWLINSDKSIENSGFGIRGKIEIPNGDVIEKSKSSSSSVRKLLEGIGDSDIYITDYVKYSGMYLSFYTLYSYNSSPLIFAGANGLGNRQVVFGFDLHRSDIALSTDFVMLVRNLLEYSFPDVIDETSYTVGDDAVLNVVSNVSNLKAKSPSGKDIFLDTSGTMATIKLDEIGTYEIGMTLAGEEITRYIYSSAHFEESKPAIEEEDFSLAGERTYDKADGEFDPLVIIFICIAVLFLADWGVYCYEKYQLR
ncbi:MAG: VWA domain-containing protein [Clostridia bacterium]|nr:VWA domain-containing protein [Clostridia bacterium]